jgi:hypothetical protein
MIHNGVCIDEMERPDVDVIPELRLALAVVTTAIADCRRDYASGRKKRYPWQSDGMRQQEPSRAEDARDFLLHRINEEGNYWGDILRYYRFQTMTPARLAQVIRHKPRTATTDSRR